MTERITLDDYRRLVPGAVPAEQPRRTDGSERRKKLALLVFIEEARRELGIAFGGTWKKGADTDSRTMYLEYPAIPGRRFRFDLAIPSMNILIDIQGGAGVIRTGPDGKLSYGGAHHSIEGRRRDIEKNNLAKIWGFVVLECEWKDVESGQLLAWLKKLCAGRLDQG